MVRECELRSCTHYALHTVTSSDGIQLETCNLHLSSVLYIVDRFSTKRARITVSNSSAVVVGDLRDWRPLSITA